MLIVQLEDRLALGFWKAEDLKKLLSTYGKIDIMDTDKS